MKKTFWVLAIMAFWCVESLAFEITSRDLEGFSYKQNILAFKDIKLPKPKPPEEGGITTGAVFILGRYLPPPYEVTVEGVHVLINGVPCTYLKRLLETEEDRKRIRHYEIAGSTENKLLDIYQRTKWYEGKNTAREKLEKFISELKDFKSLGIETRDVEPEKIFVMKMKEYKSFKTYEIRINIADSRRDVDYWIADCEKTNKQRAEGRNISECLGYEIVEEEIPGPKKLIVKLFHEKLGEFEFEVEGPEVERHWIYSFGEKMIIDKTYELWKKYNYDKSKAVKEITEFALKQPWVTSFEMVNESMGQWNLNGEFLPNLLDGRTISHKRPTRVERDKGANEYALEYTIPKVKQALKDNFVIFFNNGILFGNNQIDLLDSISDIMKSDGTLKEKQENLVFYLKKLMNDQTNSKIAAEFITAFWIESGESR